MDDSDSDIELISVFTPCDEETQATDGPWQTTEFLREAPHTSALDQLEQQVKKRKNDMKERITRRHTKQDVEKAHSNYLKNVVSNRKNLEIASSAVKAWVKKHGKGNIQKQKREKRQESWILRNIPTAGNTCTSPAGNLSPAAREELVRTMARDKMRRSWTHNGIVPSTFPTATNNAFSNPTSFESKSIPDAEANNNSINMVLTVVQSDDRNEDLEFDISRDMLNKIDDKDSVCNNTMNQGGRQTFTYRHGHSTKKSACNLLAYIDESNDF